MGFFSDNIGMAMNYNCSVFRNLWCYDISEVLFVNSDGLRFIEFKNYAESHPLFVFGRGPKYHVYRSFLFYRRAALRLTDHRHLEVAYGTVTQNGFSRDTHLLLCIRSKILHCSFSVSYTHLRAHE